MNQDEIRRKIIKIVQQHRCLYDTTMREYSLSDHRERTWEKAAAEASMKVLDIKKIYERLRQQYTRELKKSQLRGDSYENYWPFYREMSFLYPFVKPRRPKRKMTKDKKSPISSPTVDGSTSKRRDSNDFLKDAIILESDSEEPSSEEKFRVSTAHPDEEYGPTEVVTPTPPPESYAAEESDGNVVIAAESSTNVDIIICYLKIIDQKLRELPERIAEDQCINFIHQLNGVLRN